MRTPKMIFFDYGQTLVSEAAFDGVRGTAAVMRYAVSNPRRLTPQAIQREANAINRELGRLEPSTRHLLHTEVPNSIFQAYLYGSLGISFSISQAEVERIFWSHAIPTEPTEGIAELLQALSVKGIRTGVISNISFSGAALCEKLAQLLPEASFECVITSSDYLFRKPNRRIFELALEKAGLPAEEVWFCGDDLQCDILGAQACGIVPVWYTGAYTMPEQVDDPGLQIRHWDELRALLDL